MRMKSLYAVLAVLVATALSALPARAQFDVAGSYYKTFDTSTSGHGTNQSQAGSSGFLLEGRYLKSTFLGAEIAYSYNPANQNYEPTPGNCGYLCSQQPESVQAYANEVSFDWVPSLKIGNLRPFGVAGLGFVLTNPPGNEYAVNTAVKPAYVVGAGSDFAVSPRFGIRAQLRDNFFIAPQATHAYPATGKFVQLAEPTIGVYFRP